ncbi:MAG: hypothetical protein JSS07_01615 [Proteobacteria bacterium]|nr:hypothetical protein [Pseudomonadota bacterium]
MILSPVEQTINFLIDHRAFMLGYPNEVTRIAQICDYVLTSNIGTNMTIIAIIDSDRDPLKRAIFDSNELETFRLNCRQFTYHAYGIKLGVKIEFWYIGKNATAILREPAIASLKAQTYKFWVSCWALSSNKVNTNALSLKNWLKCRTLAKMLKQQIHLTPSVLSLLS